MLTQLIPLTATGRRSQIPLIPTSITIHSTGNAKSTAQNEADNVCNNNPDLQVSFHCVADDTNKIQVLPFNECAWHAGDGYNGQGNITSIAIEICESGNRRKALENALDIVRWVMKLYNIPKSEIYQHNHWSNKDCPRILRNKDYIKDGLDWDWFMGQISPTHWAEPHLYNLVAKGYIKSPDEHKDLNSYIKKGEIFALLDRITEEL